MGTTTSFFEIRPQSPGFPSLRCPGDYQLLMVGVTRAGLGQVPAVRKYVKVVVIVFQRSLTSEDLRRADSASLWK